MGSGILTDTEWLPWGRWRRQPFWPAQVGKGKSAGGNKRKITGPRGTGPQLLTLLLPLSLREVLSLCQLPPAEWQGERGGGSAARQPYLIQQLGSESLEPVWMTQENVAS